MRIASLIPSGTDITVSLGLQSTLVGVSHACDHSATHDLPILTHSVIPSSLSPLEIDRAVGEALANEDANGSLYRTDRELLRQLAPDVILTQSICDVCAVNAASIACDLPPEAHLITRGATNFAGLWTDLRTVADAAGTDASTLIASLQVRLGRVQQTVRNRARPRVLVLEWTEPPFLGGHWVPEIIERAGGEHLLGQIGEPSRRATWNEIAAADPEILIVAPCGYGLDETIAQTRALCDNPQYAQLRAVRNGQVWATNATHLFSRCTPMSIRAVEVAAGILHSEVWEKPDEIEAILVATEGPKSHITSLN
ncbi:MAG: iron complex transport system substrate-binding protein [Abditibacteriota bacterium]|nr:iron complex transport system substrate-binding protein [Abditibacteriota bacterium]